MAPMRNGPAKLTKLKYRDRMYVVPSSVLRENPNHDNFVNAVIKTIPALRSHIPQTIAVSYTESGNRCEISKAFWAETLEHVPDCILHITIDDTAAELNLPCDSGNSDSDSDDCSEASHKTQSKSEAPWSTFEPQTAEAR